MTVLSVDPGVHIGVAAWEDDGTFMKSWAVDWDGLCDLLRVYAPRTLAVENYALRSNRAKQQIGSKFEASQVIGACRYEAYRNHGTCVVQPVDGLYVGAIHAGVGPLNPRKHAPDEASAILHGVYYFVGQGVLFPESMPRIPRLDELLS